MCIPQTYLVGNEVDLELEDDDETDIGTKSRE
jgi:hypothetical protein